MKLAVITLNYLAIFGTGLFFQPLIIIVLEKSIPQKNDTLLVPTSISHNSQMTFLKDLIKDIGDDYATFAKDIDETEEYIDQQ